MPERPLPPYEEVEHTADLALRVRGSSLQALFANAARGMFQFMGDAFSLDSECFSVKLESPDAETLLVDWLNELIFLSEVHGRIFCAYNFVSISETQLHAQIGGGLAERWRERIKAATFHDLRIQREGDGYLVTIVFDV